MVKEHASSERHPLLLLLNLLFLTFAGMLSCMLIGLLFIYFTMDNSVFVSLKSGNYSIANLKVLQLFISVGTFIVPALLFIRREQDLGWEKSGFFRLRMNTGLLLLATIITFSIIPFIDWTLYLNKSMVLPEFLKELELWMRQKEEEAAYLTNQFLKMSTVNGLLFNLLLIGFIPAIGEELFFRGCLQPVFSRWAGNKHAGIWIAAIIFSAIHLQFYGFLPRMLLGAMFGYFFFWSKSLWVPILAHFVNNAAQVIIAYVYQLQGKSLVSMEENDNYSSYIIILSLVLTLFLMRVFYRLSSKNMLLDQRPLHQE